MHYFLKSRGIKNNRFMLTLYDTDLAGIDPHDPNLSGVMKQKVAREVARNYWYYLREVVRVKEDGNPRGVPYRLDRGALAYHFCTMYNMNVIFEMPRQTGKTTSAEVRFLYVYNFATTNSRIMFMHKDMKAAKENLQDIKKNEQRNKIQRQKPTHRRMALWKPHAGWRCLLYPRTGNSRIFHRPRNGRSVYRTV